jgi:hypothetical protein
MEYSKSLASLYSSEQRNIEQARAITALAFLISGEMSCHRAVNIFENRAFNSDITQEYISYIMDYCEMRELIDSESTTDSEPTIKEEKLPVIIDN